MDRTRDRLFLDKGYFGYDKRHPEYQFCIPPNKSTRAYSMASEEERSKLKSYDQKHKRLALGHVERWNREVRQYGVLARGVAYRHDPALFPHMLRDCVALRNIRHTSVVSREVVDC